jgi:catechol 2,3-dioxygenase-like lactoylglutathione lyase family enzyme
MTSGALTGLGSFSGFSVDDLASAKAFYADVLGLEVVEENEVGFGLRTADQTVFVYSKGPAHEPASYTVLNFRTPDVDGVVDALSAKGVEFLKYDGLGQDEKGIARAMGPTIAWFADPAGNVFSVIDDS